MTLTAHWNRALERTKHLETRDELMRDERKWKVAYSHYDDVVGAFVASGGRVNKSRVSAFKCIVRLNIKELQYTREIRDILDGTAPV